MANKILVDCATGESTEVEMTGAELSIFEAQRAQPEPEIGATRDERLLAAVDAAKAAVDADPLPDDAPSRDERLLAAVDAAKAAVTGGKVFSAEQAAVLSAVFDGLGKAITGEAP